MVDDRDRRYMSGFTRAGVAPRAVFGILSLYRIGQLQNSEDKTSKQLKAENCTELHSYTTAPIFENIAFNCLRPSILNTARHIPEPRQRPVKEPRRKRQLHLTHTNNGATRKQESFSCASRGQTRMHSSLGLNDRSRSRAISVSAQHVFQPGRPRTLVKQ